MNKYLVYSLIFVGGVILADRVRALPGGNMLPKL